MADSGPQVSVLVGSSSDASLIEPVFAVLDDYGLTHEYNVISAHRKPDALADYVKSARSRGIQVIIAAAGGAAALPGAVAAHTTLPVIGVPLPSSEMNGIDSLHAIVQMPPGIPVATMGIGAAGARNSGLFAARIIALSNPALAKRYRRFVNDQRKKVLAADAKLQKKNAPPKKTPKRDLQN